MNILECIKSALYSILSNKMRSFLTMLGIIIGISAVITITTLGSTLKATISNAFSSFGSNYIDLYLWGDEETDDNLIDLEMIQGLQNAYPGEFCNASSEYLSSSKLYNKERKEVNVSICGTFDGYIDYMGYEMLAGRNINTNDLKQVKNCAVVSDIFVRQYFKNGEEPIGQTILFPLDMGSFMECTIVGVYKYNDILKMYLQENVNDESELQTQVLIPVTSSFKMTNRELKTDYITMSTSSNLGYEELKQHMVSYFEEQLSEYPSITIEAYSSMEDLIETENILNIVTIVIAVIAALSLVVGGVGVMNIMLVTVTERTAEIGIRKALGAKNKNIETQFLIESTVLCIIGGLFGVLLGLFNGEIICIIARKIIANYPEYSIIFKSVQMSPSILAILISVLFSTLTGIFFGSYPAKKAAKLNPIDALRYNT